MNMNVLPFWRRLLVGIFPFAFPAVAVAEDATPARTTETPPRQVVNMRLVSEEDAAPKLGYGNCQWLEPHDAAGETLLAQPSYKSAKPIYYSAHYGDGKDSSYSFVLDESGGPGKGYDTIYVDANNDNRIDAGSERFAVTVGNPAHSEPIRIRLMVSSGGVTAPYHVSLSAFEYSDENHPIRSIHVNLRDSSYYVGEAMFQGERRQIAVGDLNSNGLFHDVEQGLFRGDRFFVDLDGDGRFANQRNPQESFPYGGFTRIAGQWYSIVASPDGSRVEIATAQPPLGRIEAPAGIEVARLNSPTQPLDLTFQDGVDQAVAGTYRVDSVRLLGLPGSFGERGPQLTVREGQTTRLEAGLPLKVEALASPDEERTLRISLRITGAAGETYRWSPRAGSSSKAGFEIVDVSGKVIASGQFAYG
jgi:hypothetical protein